MPSSNILMLGTAWDRDVLTLAIYTVRCCGAGGFDQECVLLESPAVGLQADDLV